MPKLNRIILYTGIAVTALIIYDLKNKTNRTKLMTSLLLKLKFNEVYGLDCGFYEWKKKGYNVEYR